MHGSQIREQKCYIEPLLSLYDNTKLPRYYFLKPGEKQTVKFSGGCDIKCIKLWKVLLGLSYGSFLFEADTRHKNVQLGKVE